MIFSKNKNSLIILLGALSLSACDDDKKNVRAIIYVDDMNNLTGTWYYSQDSSSYNANGQRYKNTANAETTSITATSETRGTMSFCNKEDITIELVQNTIYQVVEVAVDEDGDGNQDLDTNGLPITEERFSQLFVLDSTISMQQPYSFTCDTPEEISELGCTDGEFANGLIRMNLLVDNIFGDLALNNFETTIDTGLIGAGNPETLNVDCFSLSKETETDGEGTEGATVKASNTNYAIDLRFENTIDYDPINFTFTNTNIAWLDSLESFITGKTWQYKDATENAPNPEHFRTTDSGTFTLATSAITVTADVILGDNNEIEEDNAGVTSVTNYAISASTNLTFELSTSNP